MSLQISAPMALSSLDILMMMINQPSFDRPFLNVTKEASTPPCTKPMCGIVDTDPADITVSQPISDVTLHYLSPGECPFNVELLQRHSSTTMTSSVDTIHQSTLMTPQRAFGTSTGRIFNSMISVRVESDVKDCNYSLARTQSCGEFRFSSITLPANAGHMTSSIHDPCRFVHGCHDTIPKVTFNVTVSAQHQVSATPMYNVMTHQPHCYMPPRSRHSYSVPVSFQLATFSVIINRKCFSLSALIVRSSSRRLRQPSVSALFKHSSNATMSYGVQNTSTKATVSDHGWTPVTAFATSSTTDVRSLVNEGPRAAEQKSSIVPWLSTTEPVGGTNDSGGFQRCDFNTFQPITGTGQVKPRHGYAANRNVNAQSENQSKCLRSTESLVQNDGLDSTGRLLQAPSNRWEVGAAVGGDSDSIFDYFPSQENHGPNWNNDFHDDRLAFMFNHHNLLDGTYQALTNTFIKLRKPLLTNRLHRQTRQNRKLNHVRPNQMITFPLLSHIKINQTPSAKLRLPCKTIEWTDLVDVLDKFKKPKTLGGGVYARVRLMKIISTDQMCAVKLPREELEEEDVSQVLETEINSLAALNGLDCVPQLYGVSKTEAGVPFLVQEFIGDPSKSDVPH
ncbi:hypothetical protein BSL78_26613 [Apostichopus japonicus]|uniref:Protein kinase domain-containing protein n=1 Tax=Stichopus japonicus TaxID=307972 RepID=A0A2G8JLC3_STIJA|nr:hypothetical protein BSL78_26613 [Apostichopus japonicus]